MGEIQEGEWGEKRRGRGGVDLVNDVDSNQCCARLIEVGADFVDDVGNLDGRMEGEKEWIKN